MFKDNKNYIQNDTYDNQDNLNYSEILEIEGIKYGDKIGNWKIIIIMSLLIKVITSNTDFYKVFLIMVKNNDKHNVKVLSLTNELKENNF